MFQLPFTVKKSVVIHATPQKIFETLMDFSTWGFWSPWICQEPECPVEIHGKPGSLGHSQTWNGQRIGSGNMTLIQIEKNTSLEYDLNFLSPWKSHSFTNFFIEETNEGSIVTWSMKGSLPIFLFFLKKMMSAWVGSDYSRGLSMLKDFIEHGKVHSKTSLHGLSLKNGFEGYGFRRKCSFSDLGPLMSQDFQDLQKKIQNSELPKPDTFFSVYHTYDFITEICDYTAAVGYTNKLESHPEDLECISYPSHQTLSATHIGEYKHLGNLWSTVIGAQRSQKLKKARSQNMYEIYLNMPGDVPNEELLVQAHLPLKP